MTEDLELESRARRVGIVLRVVGLMFVVFFSIAGVASATQADIPDLLFRLTGWGSIGDAEEQMLSIVYVVWGVHLWFAASDPAAHKSLVDFTLTANAAHFGLMFIQAIVMSGEHAHLYGDVPLGWAVMVVLGSVWLPYRRMLRVSATPLPM